MAVAVARSPRVVAADDAQQRFLACAGHELRTPLAAQRALLEVALADPSTDRAGWREVAERLLCLCRQQERLLESCLAFARVRGGPRTCEPVDLAAVAADALDAQDVDGLRCTVVLEPAWTAGDPCLLERLAANLVSNAVRHNVAGGRLELSTRSGPGRAVLSVANSGAAISAAELTRLFQPFQRLGPRRGLAPEGVGLGLAIVQAIADAHGAAVTARARTGGGLAIDVAFRSLD